MSPNRSKSVREIDGLSLIFINPYIPVLTLRIHCIEAALQLSRNTALLAVCYIYTRVISNDSQAGTWGLGAFINKSYRLGARTENCGTRACISRGVDNSPSIVILNFLFLRNKITCLINFVEKCNCDSLYSNSGCHVVSKAFLISKNTTAIGILLLRFRVV
jgi:hypothetical protein